LGGKTDGDKGAAGKRKAGTDSPHRTRPDGTYAVHIRYAWP